MDNNLAVAIFQGENEYELNKKIRDLLGETGYSLKEVNEGLDFLDLINLLNTPNLFEGNILYKITNDNILSDDKNLEVFKEYLKNPSPFSKGIIVVKKADARKKVSKFFKESGLLFDFQLKKGNELRKWVKEYLWQHGYNITDDGVAYLIDVVGENQTMIENEMKKLFIYEPENKNIKINDLEKIITNNVQSNIFNLLDNMFGDRGKMLTSLENLFKLNEPVPLIIYMIIRDLRILIRIKWFLKEKYRDDKIASILQLHPYVLKKKIELSRKLTFEEIFKYIRLFYDIEERFKSGKGDGKVLLRSTLLAIK